MVIVNRTQYDSMRSQAASSAARRQSADQELLEQRRKLEQLARDGGGMSKEDLRAIQKRFDATNKALRDELEELRERFGQELGKQALENKRAIAEIRHLAEANQHDLEGLSREITGLENSIKAHFDRMEKRAQDNRKQALFYYEQLREIVEQVDELFPDKYEVLYPDQLQPGAYVLRSALGYVLEDIDRGNLEAAIGLAQTYLPEAVSTLGQLEFFHTAFLNTEADAKKALCTLGDRVRKLEEPKRTELCVGKAEYEDEHGIAYWARELFCELKRRSTNSETRFGICDEAHDTAGLTLIRQDVDTLDEQLSICEQIESNERRLHYECCERASQVFDALDANDPKLWTLEELHVNEADLREPIYMTLTRPEGYRITVACCPERGANLTAPGNVRCELEVFDSGEEQDDVARCRIIYGNIATVLATSGIVIAPQPEDGAAAATSRSFIRSAIDNEEQARNNWLSAARRAIGFEEA